MGNNSYSRAGQHYVTLSSYGTFTDMRADSDAPLPSPDRKRIAHTYGVGKSNVTLLEHF